MSGAGAEWDPRPQSQGDIASQGQVSLALAALFPHRPVRQASKGPSQTGRWRGRQEWGHRSESGSQPRVLLAGPHIQATGEHRAPRSGGLWKVDPQGTACSPRGKGTQVHRTRRAQGPGRTQSPDSSTSSDLLGCGKVKEGGGWRGGALLSGMNMDQNEDQGRVDFHSSPVCVKVMQPKFKMLGLSSALTQEADQ